MALTKFYLHPFRRGTALTDGGYDTAQLAQAAATDLLLNSDNMAPGTRIAVVQLVGVVDLDNPVTKNTLAANL